MKNVIYVNDGENLSVIVRLQPTVADPAHFYKGVCNTYRVVAGAFGIGKLELVPLKTEPTFLTKLDE